MHGIRKSWSLLSLLVCSNIWADNTNRWNSMSDLTAAGLPLAAVVTTLVNQDTQGMRELVLSTGSALAAAELLKRTVHSTRPDGSDNRSFPSAHTAIAFSAATFIDHRYGEQYAAWTPVLYGAAALTGLARVEANKHRWADVFAGAAIGWGTAHFWSTPTQAGQLSVVPAGHGLALGWSRTF
ncbi:MAG: phosphatase PAP2 family protein [Limnohabitans sp.]